MHTAHDFFQRYCGRIKSLWVHFKLKQIEIVDTKMLIKWIQKHFSSWTSQLKTHKKIQALKFQVSLRLFQFIFKFYFRSARDTNKSIVVQAENTNHYCGYQNDRNDSIYNVICSIFPEDFCMYYWFLLSHDKFKVSREFCEK